MEHLHTVTFKYWQSLCRGLQPSWQPVKKCFAFVSTSSLLALSAGSFCSYLSNPGHLKSYAVCPVKHLMR